MKKLKCCGCKDRFDSTTMLKFNNSTFHSYDCATAYARKKSDRDAKAKVKKDKQESSKALRDLNRRTLKWQHSKTQTSFNKMRRLQELKWFDERGVEPVCISCQKPLGNDQWCCGHFKTVGSNGRLRYDSKNAYLQHNRNCNMGLSGDVRGYMKGLISRFGESKAAEIEEYCTNNNAPLKRTWQEIEELRKQFNLEIKRLENDN